MRGEAVHLSPVPVFALLPGGKGSVLQVLGKSDERVLKVKNDVNEDITLIPG